MRKLFGILLSLMISTPLTAGQTDYATGKAAMTWLKRETSAKAAAMAGVFNPSGDADSVTSHPAGMADLVGNQVTLMHHVGFEGQTTEHVAYGRGLGDGHGVVLGVDYMNFGAVETYSIDPGTGQPVQGTDLNPSGLSLALGYGKRFETIAAGLTAKFVREDLGAGDASTLAADLGGSWNSDDVRLDLAVLNLGGQVYGSPLPMQLRTGALFNMGLEGRQDLALGVALAAPFSDLAATAASLGAEYRYGGRYALRAGFKTGSEVVASGLTAGAGLVFAMFGLDYAYETVGVLGASHRVSLRTGF